VGGVVRTGALPHRGAVYWFLLHRTSFGRRIFAIGNNPVAAQFSGVRVGRIKFVLFCLTGLMAGIASVLITSRLGSTRPSIAARL
jgi:rhamnose transport system permease protein